MRLKMTAFSKRKGKTEREREHGQKNERAH